VEDHRNARLLVLGFSHCLLHPLIFVRALLRAGVDPSERGSMNLEYLVSGVITVALLVYLTYALLRPEKFLSARRLQ